MMRCPYCFENGEDKTCRRCGRETEEMAEGLECSTIVSADDLVVLLGIEIERLKEREHHNCATILHLRDYVKKENSDLKELRARVAELEQKLSAAIVIGADDWHDAVEKPKHDRDIKLMFDDCVERVGYYSDMSVSYWLYSEDGSIEERCRPHAWRELR